MYKITFYVPIESVDRVKMAMFTAGAGKYKNYEYCSFQTLGIGQFKPLVGANPSVGNINAIEKVEEFKVEMICEKNIIKKVILKMKEAHPYEEVAYNVVELLEF